MVALVDNHEAVVGNAVVHFPLPHETLHRGDVDRAVEFLLPSSQAPEAVVADIEELRQPVYPLFEQLLAMHDDQRVDLAFGDQPSGHHGLAERRGRRENAGVVRGQCACGGLLIGTQVSPKGRRDPPAETPLVVDRRPDAQSIEQFHTGLETAARQTQVLRSVLDAVDDPRLVVGGQAHRLGPIELRVLECAQAHQPRDQSRWEAGLGDVDAIGKDQFDTSGKLSNDGRNGLAPGGRRQPRRRREVLVLRDGAHPHDPSSVLRRTNEGFRARQRHSFQGGEEYPLIRMGLEVVVDENTIAGATGTALQRQGDQIPETSPWQGVLARKETIIRTEPEIGAPIHGLGE